MQIVIENNTINCDEFLVKYKKNNTLKSKIIDFEYKNSFLTLNVVENWQESDNVALNDLISNLIGNEPVSELSKIYEKRKNDGWVFYNKIRTDFVYLINIGQANGDDEYFIQKKMKDVKANLLSGDWVTAKKDLIAVEVEGAFTEQIKTSFLTQIQSYIEANYPQTSW